jgi:hypothetical protein
VSRARIIAIAVAASLLFAVDARANGALESVASQVAKGLAKAPASAIVVSAPLTSDVPAPRAEELASRLAQLVAGALGAATRAHPQTATLAQARAVAAKGSDLVFVQPAIERGTLRLTIDVYAVVANAWDRVRDPTPPPRGHAFAQAPIDAEVRAFLASIALEHASVHRAKHDEGDVLAAACGDLDGDGGMELALVSRARVAVGRIVNGKFVPRKTAAWSSLAARAPVPMREAIGGASIVTDGDQAKLFVGTTDRGGVALDASLSLVGSLRGIPIAASEDACAAPNAGGSSFEGDPVACALDASQRAKRFASPTARCDAMAGFDVVRPDGSVRAAAIAREPGGKLDARFGEATHVLDGVGAQIALGDLDQDGSPEIVASAADGDDAITIWSWDGASDPKERLRLPAPGGVRALCTCPPEEGGAPALVAVVDGEVWIVR